MMSDRLSQIENSLRRLYRQLANKQETLDDIAPEEKERIRQQIERFKQQEIQPLEAERQEILVAASEQLIISEPEAATIVGEIVTGVNQIELQSSDTYPSEVMAILWEIREILNKPEEPAAIRLKAAISTMPPFFWITLDTELNGEKFCQRHFPTFTRLITPLIKSAAKK